MMRLTLEARIALFLVGFLIGGTYSLTWYFSETRTSSMNPDSGQALKKVALRDALED